MPGSRSRIASYSASVWPPGTPNTCRTPCSASSAASRAPPCLCLPGEAALATSSGGPPSRAWSGTGDPEQPGRRAAEHEFGVRAEVKRPDLTDRVVGAHVERAVRAEQDLPGAGVADQVREQVVVVGDGVV